MGTPRVLGMGCASRTAMGVENVELALQDVTCFLEALGDVHRDVFSVSCLVEHPDKLGCVFKAEVFELVDGNYVLEFNRVRGDSLLFALLLRLYRVYLSTGMLPILFPGDIVPRCRLGPATEPSVNVPRLRLPPAMRVPHRSEKTISMAYAFCAHMSVYVSRNARPL